MKKAILCVFFVLAFALNANAVLVGLGEGDFTPAASEITFQEVPYGQQNPVYNYDLDMDAVYDFSVSFGGYFLGGLGTPTVGADLALDPEAPYTFVTNDGATPDYPEPTLSGYPTFNGPIAILFSQDVAAVGLEAGYFNAIGGTSIAAYDRQGNLLGQIANAELGFEFFGLGDSTGDAVIAGIQFWITGAEPAGYEIDDVVFAFDAGGYNPPSVPEPATMFLLGTGLLGMAAIRRKIKK